MSSGKPTAGNGVIAIDGPSGTGKSTVARAVAERVRAGYLDTGALYRIVTVHVLESGIDPEDAAAVAASLPGLDFATPTDPRVQRQELHGTDVTARIREDDVTAAVSAVSANPAVRRFLLDRQRKLAYAGRMVVEGRDIGTVIAPDAAVKIYLTADPAVRAQRRQRQHAAVAPSASAEVSAVAADLQRRDALDSGRQTAPLQQAVDAVVVDSTGLTIDDTVAAVLRIAAEKGIS